MFKNYIWIVDDTKIVTAHLREILKEHLQRKEEILIFHNGRDAITCRKKPILAFVDIILPDVRGEEVINFIEKHHPFTPIICITGYYDILNVKSVLLAGADEVIPKPLSPYNIKQAIERASLVRDEKVNKLLISLVESFKNSIEKLVSTKGRWGLLEEIASSLLGIIKCDRVSIIERIGKKMRVIISKGEGAERLIGKEFSVEKSISGYVSTRKTDYLSITPEETPEPIKNLLREDVHASLVGSLSPDENLVISASMLESRFNKAQKELFFLFTTVAEVILSEVSIEEKIISTFLKVLNMRDAYTYKHSIEVTRLCMKIAKSLKLEKKRVRYLRIAALFHDIGKVIIEDTILMKPGRLTDEEFSKIKAHPYYGRKLLEGIPGFELAKEIIHQHHERLNGKGYPNGLKQDDILLEAKILAVADTFHATISDRPYRKGKSIERALMELMEDEGLDQAVVETLINIVKQEPPIETTVP